MKVLLAAPWVRMAGNRNPVKVGYMGSCTSGLEQETAVDYGLRTRGWGAQVAAGARRLVPWPQT